MTLAQTREYLGAWLRAGLGPGTAPLVLTPDAAMLVWHRATGDLRMVNRIATNMVLLAAREGRRVLSSWEAWAASDGDGDGHHPTVRPAGWPGEDIVAILNRCRERAGLPPRGSL